MKVRNEMSLNNKIAFVCYLLVSLLLMGFGARYYFWNELMPYHLAGLAVPWESLPETVRFMFLEFMHGVGAGFMTISLAMLTILFIPFRRGECWANWTLPILGLTVLGLLANMLCRIIENTPANPPITTIAVAAGVIVLGAILTICPCKCCKTDKE